MLLILPKQISVSKPMVNSLTNLGGKSNNMAKKPPIQNTEKKKPPSPAVNFAFEDENHHRQGKQNNSASNQKRKIGSREPLRRLSRNNDSVSYEDTYIGDSPIF